MEVFFLRTTPNDSIFLLEKYAGDNNFLKIQGNRRHEMEQDPAHIGTKSSIYCAPTVCQAHAECLTVMISPHAYYTDFCEGVSGESLPSPPPHISV